jgi:methylated-DNA-[protein]-cysteine S-methyltransferase
MSATKYVESPVGALTLREEHGAVVSVAWNGGLVPTDQSGSPVLKSAAEWIRDFFADEIRPVDFPLGIGGTHFQHTVWRRLAELPAGSVMTYGELARELGTSARAVGGACGANPLPIIVPCHRVVGAAGALGGYSGGEGLATKRALLDREAASRG